MPDISLCENEQCPSKDDCYRFKAIPDITYQAYDIFEPENGENKCEHFIKIEHDKKH